MFRGRNFRQSGPDDGHKCVAVGLRHTATPPPPPSQNEPEHHGLVETPGVDIPTLKQLVLTQTAEISLSCQRCLWFREYSFSMQEERRIRTLRA